MSLKGDTFVYQNFPSEIFALFQNTFLNGTNGVIEGFKNSMDLNTSNNTITISSGAVVIQGRFLHEDSSSTLTVNVNTNTYCKLVIEIDLDQTNTTTELNQAKYKILQSTTAYPDLTQTDIVNNVSGIYQFPLAQFMATSSGISNFVDLREFCDFASIYETIREHIEDIDSGSIFATDEELEELRSHLEGAMAELEQVVNEDITTNINAINANLNKKAQYTDFVVTTNTVTNGSADWVISTSTRMADLWATITKADYYPIALLGVRGSNSNYEFDYRFGYLSHQTNGSCRAHWYFTNNNGGSYNANSLPSCAVTILWGKIR